MVGVEIVTNGAHYVERTPTPISTYHLVNK